MTYIVWEFEVPASHTVEFERDYGPQGVWVELFRRDPAYRGTTLLRDYEHRGRYLTIDRWEHRESYEAFRAQFAMEYQSIDTRTGGLTSSEKRIGIFGSL